MQQYCVYGMKKQRVQRGTVSALLRGSVYICVWIHLCYIEQYLFMEGKDIHTVMWGTFSAVLCDNVFLYLKLSVLRSAML